VREAKTSGKDICCPIEEKEIEYKKI